MKEEEYYAPHHTCHITFLIITPPTPVPPISFSFTPHVRKAFTLPSPIASTPSPYSSPPLLYTAIHLTHLHAYAHLYTFTPVNLYTPSQLYLYNHKNYTSAQLHTWPIWLFGNQVKYVEVLNSR